MFVKVELHGDELQGSPDFLVKCETYISTKTGTVRIAKVKRIWGETQHACFVYPGLQI